MHSALPDNHIDTLSPPVWEQRSSWDCSSCRALLSAPRHSGCSATPPAALRRVELFCVWVCSEDQQIGSRMGATDGGHAAKALSEAIEWHRRAQRTGAGSDAPRRGRQAPVAPLHVLRQLGRTLLDEIRAEIERGEDEGSGQGEDPEAAEDVDLWLDQMTENYRSGNLDLTDLADASCIGTLLRLLRVPDPEMVAEVQATLAKAAATADVLPPAQEWSRLLEKLLEGVEPAPLDDELCAAAWAGDVGQVGLLLAQPSPRTGPDACGTAGNTALGLAALGGRARVVKLLLQAKADPDLPNSAGARAIHQAAWADQEAVAIVLLQTDTKRQLCSQTKAGDTALAVAAIRNSTRVATVLIRAGADLDCTNGAGATPLVAAATRGNVEVAQLLLGAGSSKQAMLGDGSGRTLIDWAAEETHKRLNRSNNLQKRRLLIAKALIEALHRRTEDGELRPNAVAAPLGSAEVIVQPVIVKGSKQQRATAGVGEMDVSWQMSSEKPKDVPNERSIEEQVTALCKTHNPEKLGKVPGLLKKYKGSEGKLMRLFYEKWVVDSVCNYVIAWSDAPQLDSDANAIENEDKPSWSTARPYRRVYKPTVSRQALRSDWTVVSPIILNTLTMTHEARELLQQLAGEAKPSSPQEWQWWEDQLKHAKAERSQLQRDLEATLSAPSDDVYTTVIEVKGALEYMVRLLEHHESHRDEVIRETFGFCGGIELSRPHEEREYWSKLLENNGASQGQPFWERDTLPVKYW